MNDLPPADWPTLLGGGRAPRTGLGHAVVYEPVTTSTMDMAERALARGPVRAGTVFLAGRQTQGRGTSDRRWESDEGGLWQTIVFDAPERAGKAPIVFLSGVAVSAMLGRYGIDAWPKWVNDVIAGGRKIAGTLVRLVGRHFLVGIGLNVNQERLRGEATSAGVSMRMLTGRAYPLAEVWADVVRALQEEYDRPEPLLPRMREACRMLGQTFVAVHARDGRERELTVLGIDDAGHLHVRWTDGGEEVWHSPDPWRIRPEPVVR